MDAELKSKTIFGVIWSLAENFGGQSVRFVIGIVLARFLTPSDYGVIGMLTVFIVISQGFLDCGFGHALIQKKDCTDTDYSTVFHFNMVVAIILYISFFFAAPWIAAFYHMPILENVSRVVMLCLIFNALSLVQSSRLSILLDFKTLTIAAFISTLVSGVAGVILAYCGYGVWALVWQGVIAAVVRLAYIWIVSKWYPKMVFSKESFCRLFGFGSKILAGSLIDAVYSNAHTLIIGRYYPAAALGTFNRARSFAELPLCMLFYPISKVNYPVLAKLQDDHAQLLAVYRRLVQVPLYVVYPCFLGMAALANPLIMTLIGDKWIACVPILVVLCFSGLFDPLTSLNLKLLYVKGRSDLVLKLEVIKKPIAFLILACTAPFGIMPLCLGMLGYNVVAFVLNCRYTGKILNYGLRKQVREVLPILINSLLMFSLIHIVIWPFRSPFVQLAIGMVSGVAVYGLIGFLTHNETQKYFLDMILNKFLRPWVRKFRDYYASRRQDCQMRQLPRSYADTLGRLREEIQTRKLRVVFLAMETSKWKCQSLYELLASSEHYDSIVALTIPKNCEGKSATEVNSIMSEIERFFTDRGVRTCRAYDPDTQKCKSISELQADIVFYQQPWLSVREQNPVAASKSALTYYIPYYVPTFGEPEVDCQPLFHRQVYGHIVLNAVWASYYDSALRGLSTAGSLLPLGHTMFDEIDRQVQVAQGESDSVIYAPHFTFNHPNNHTVLHYSTFSENGREILSYAQRHPEFHWIFKPHPSLYSTLLKTGAMTKAEADDYYSAWASIGEVCLDGNYIKHFARSSALITDCGSFLVEYAGFGRPIIHLLNAQNEAISKGPFAPMFQSYYAVHNATEMRETFKLVLEERKDPRRGLRLDEVRKSGIAELHAAENIFAYFEQLIEFKEVDA